MFSIEDSSPVVLSPSLVFRRGPLLFNLYLTDLPKALNCRCLMYADDLKIYKEITKLDDCLELQSDLDLINDCCALNQLTLNTAKCSTISFTRRQRPMLFDYNINGVSLTRVSEIRDRGVTFDTKLSFRSHTTSVFLNI